MQRTARIAATWSAVATLAACSQTVEHELPPPVAGLVHAELARVGEAVTFDGATSAVAQSAAQPARLVGFRLAVADGSPAVDLALPVTQHTFLLPGTYAVELTITDDHGRKAAVTSAVRIVEDFAPTCDGATPCAAGPCLGGACAVLACGGDPACPASLGGGAVYCNRGQCSATAPAASDQVPWTGEDAGALALDGR